ncbi:MAG: adenylate/guanylate cyclase domain-containing protein [Polyangiaceae bacterium]
MRRVGARCGDADHRRRAGQPAAALLPPVSLPPASLPAASLAPGSTAPPSSDAWSEERKLATVLFGDLTEFTAISAGLEPDRVRELANDCFEPVTAEVERRGGRIVKYIGDGVMAVFGVPLSGEDDPRRAVQAALAIMERISEVSRRTVARYGTPVNMRIGINTGWMMVGSVGARGSASPDVMGWTVNVASRIEGIARPGEVLVGQATFRLIERWFEVESRGPVRLRGVSEPVPVHRVLRERAEEAQPSHRTAGAEPFLRERELAILQGAFDALARQPRARVVELVGEAGLGKSRLVDELAARLGDDARHPEVLRAAAVLGATDRAAPLSFLERLLRQRFGVRSAEPTSEARARVAAGIARAFGPDDTDAGELAAGTLASLIGEPGGDSDPAASGAPPEQLAGEDAMLAALAAWVRRLAGDRAACLLCTDLQWADDRSLDVLERLPQALGDAAVLLVLSARRELAERRPRWSETSLPDEAATRIELAPLPAADIRRFLAALLPPGGAPERIVDALVGRAEGSPELARELVRLLVERGAIVLDDEQRPTGWRADRLGQIELPETVQGALQARLDGLPRGERDLLRRAAIVGRVFWRGAVEALGDAGELEGRRSQRPGDPLSVRRDVATALESLERKGLVRRSETSLLDGEPELAFHTQALRDLTYRSIPEKGRQPGHLVVAGWLGDRPGGAGTAQAEVAAHLAAGGDLVAARVAYLAAARRAARVSAHDDAAPLYERALELGDTAGPDLAGGMRELALMRARAGRYDAALAALDDAAAALARHGDDRVAEAWLELDRSRVLKDCGRAEDQRAAIDRALGAVGDTAAGGLGVQLWATRAFARLEAGDTSGARADCERGLALGARAEHAAGADLAVWQQAMARLHNTLGGIRLYYDADLSGAEESYHRALALRRAAGDQQGELDALINLGAIAFERRDFTGAAARFGEGLAAARAARWVKYIAVCASNLGQAELAAGDPSAAVERLRQATDLARQAGLLEVLADGTRAMAEALLRKGSAQEALAVADKSIEHARRARIPRFEAAAHAVAMECLLGGARPGQGTAAGEARDHLSAAAELLRASGHKSSAAEIAELEAKLERAERGWAPTVVVDRPSSGKVPPSGRGTRS